MEQSFLGTRPPSPAKFVVPQRLRFRWIAQGGRILRPCTEEENKVFIDAVGDRTRIVKAAAVLRHVQGGRKP